MNRDIKILNKILTNQIQKHIELHIMNKLDLSQECKVSLTPQNQLAQHVILIQRRQWHPTPVLLPGKSHGWRSLVGCSPWGRQQSDTTEQFHFHFSLSCTGEGNGNPLQCSCLENPRDRGAWWAAVYGVAQSWTRLKRLSSSSNPHPTFIDKDLKTQRGQVTCPSYM